MCVVSMVGDFYGRKFEPFIQTQQTITWEPTPQIVLRPEITREEFDQLRRDVQDMKKLLKMALKYDRDHDQPGCQIEEKIDLLRQVAKIVGVVLEGLPGAEKEL